MSFIQRQTTRITGDLKDDNALRRKSSAHGGTSKVPHAKKPRSRPPTGLRDKLGFLQAHLPSYSGPYSVGSMDIEVPAENPRTFSNITRSGRHVLQLETVLFTLYYPAAFGAGYGKDPAGFSKWSRETWLPRPRVEAAKGYAKFAGIPDSVGIPFFASTTMLTKLRAFRNCPLATHWPPEGNSKLNGYKIKNKQGPPPPGASDEPQFPLLFFSHGLGGSRTAYSTMCGEFASYGFLVCAMEHRDGSGARTFVNHPKMSQDGSAEHEEKLKNVDHTEEELRKGYHNVDYIFPKDNPKDTAPNNEKGVDSGLRGAQIELRLAELEEAYRVLREIYEGNGDTIARQNLRRKGYVGGSSRGLTGVDWSKWKKRFHIDKVTMAGHSFGAATIVEVLRDVERFKNVQAGIIYDIWGAPVKQPEEDQKHRIQIPILGVNSEAFMYWQRNFEAVMSLMNEAKDRGAPAFLCTVRGSVHISQSDFSVLYNHITSFFMKATVHPQRAIDLNISASLEFLRDVTEGAGKAIIQRCLTDEELLKTTPLEEVPIDQKPDDEWIATRLKVPNEFQVRFSAKLQRKLKRKKQHGFYNPGDEIWMHCKPSPEELRQWRVEHRCTLRSDVDSTECSSEERAPPLSNDVKHEKAESCNAPDEIAQDASTINVSGDALQGTWLGCHPALKSSTSLVEPQEGLEK